VRRLSVVLLAALSLSGAPVAAADPVPPVSPGLVPGYDDPASPRDWEGQAQVRDVRFPSRQSGASLYGTLWSPASLDARTPLPVILILPGSGNGTQSGYQWAAHYLASQGYIALVVDPQGVGKSDIAGRCDQTPTADDPSPCPGVPFQEASNWNDAGESALDFLLSSDNPLTAFIDRSQVGAAGHSLGARSVSYLQGVDHRIDAIVAWDNLATDLGGDAGSPSGGPPESEVLGGELPGPPEPVTPRVPAMGQASDTGGPPSQDPENKKTAFSAWRKAGIPSMEIVFANSLHAWWNQGLGPDRTSDDQRLIAYYTGAWFDLFLKHDLSAIHRLMAMSVLGTPRNDLLSKTFNSAAFVQGIDCPVLTLC
jgi:dienelactone hydrolase